MATSRVKTSSILQGFPKSRSLLAGNAYFQPTSYESIATTTVGSGGTATVTFSSIPATYKHLQIRMMAKDNRAGLFVSNAQIQFNSDTAANYTSHFLLGDGSTATSAGYTAQTEVFAARIPGASSAANTFGVAIVDIVDYANTSKYKTLRSLSGEDQNGSTWEQLYLISSLWLSTAAISSITLFPVGPLFSQYSSFALYGIKGA
jgi:hypothetical protein